MSAAQIESLIIQKSKGLPAEMLQEVLDFIEFLKFKKTELRKDSTLSALSELNITSAGHLEEEFLDYKSVYPNE